MISAFYVINLKGEVVISRSFRGDVSNSASDAFRMKVIAAKETHGAPVLNIDNYNFMYTRQGDLYVVCVTRLNANPTLAFQMMFNLVDVFKAYFGGSFDEDTVRNNFVLIYELLDETIDYGYPQTLSIEQLKLYIKVGQVKEPLPGVGGNEPRGLTSTITGGIDWRQEGKYKYRKNEVFIDVLESVNLLMSSKGAILRNDVSGQIIMKAYLSGMPECKFGLNDKLVMDREHKSGIRRRGGSGIAIDDVTFHRAVRLGKFDADRTISFIPPDGEFELQRYRITENVNLPFTVIPVVSEHGRTRVEMEIKVKGNFSPKLFATNVVVKIPTPKNTARCRISVASGKAKYEPEHNAIIWRIRKFPGDADFILKGEVEMMVTVREKAWSRPPITMEFQVPMFTASGLHVRFLKVFEKSNYQTIKWVRYITRAGQYQIRI